MKEDDKKPEEKPEDGKASAASRQEQLNESKISDQEAKRWLNILKENRKKYLQKKLKRQQNYNVEKDW